MQSTNSNSGSPQDGTASASTGLLRGPINTTAEAQRVIARVAKLYIGMAILLVLMTGLGLVQRPPAGRVGEIAGTLIGELVPALILAGLAFWLKRRRSVVAAWVLTLIAGLSCAFGTYFVLIVGVANGNDRASMTGALIVVWWAVFLLASWRACRATRVLRLTA